MGTTVSNILKLLLIINLCNFSIATANTTKFQYRSREKEIIDYILHSSKYDNRIRPSNGTLRQSDKDAPVNIWVSMFIRSIWDLDDVNMDYKVQVTFRQSWTDERLQFKHIDGADKIKYLTLTDSSRIWMPDIFFSNEKLGRFHNVLLPNSYMRIFPSGQVLHSIRLTLQLSCPMNLLYMPFDHQVCSIKMASYGYTTDDIIFFWKQDDPVQVVKNLHLQRFTLQKFDTKYCNSKTNTGEYSCLNIDFTFKREFPGYLIQIYIPCSMFVLLSFVSFWIDKKAVTARLLLGVTTLLAASFHIARFGSTLPKVSYTKAIDIWTGMTLTFIFATILEFATVHYLSRREEKQASYKMHSNTNIEDYRETEHNGSTTTKTVDTQGDIATIQKMSTDDPESGGKPSSPSSTATRAKKLYNDLISRMSKALSKSIDILSRVLFPFTYLLFIIIYFIVYSNKSDTF